MIDSADFVRDDPTSIVSSGETYSGILYLVRYIPRANVCDAGPNPSEIKRMTDFCDVDVDVEVGRGRKR